MQKGTFPLKEGVFALCRVNKHIIVLDVCDVPLLEPGHYQMGRQWRYHTHSVTFVGFQCIICKITKLLSISSWKQKKTSCNS